ncbi:hypothetical protein LguiA_006981 [Lonicera macranthoides]
METLISFTKSSPFLYNKMNHFSNEPENQRNRRQEGRGRKRRFSQVESAPPAYCSYFGRNLMLRTPIDASSRCVSYLRNGLCFTLYGRMFLFIGKAVGTLQKSKAVGTSDHK